MPRPSSQFTGAPDFWNPTGQRGQYRPIGPGQLRRPGLALEYGDLVAQGEDLGVFGPVGACDQGKPAEGAEYRQITES